MEYRYLFIHCTATPEGREVSEYDIYRWHLSPRKIDRQRWKYMSKVYSSRNQIPRTNNYRIDVLKDEGRGWDRVGYTTLVKLNGDTFNFVNHNGDNWIDDVEMTYGVIGQNMFSKHFVYAGGVDEFMQPKNTVTWHQEMKLISLIRHEVWKHPQIKVGGHNQFANKSCPSFDVPNWLRLHLIPEKNIMSEKIVGLV